jgi:hypothetical protein
MAETRRVVLVGHCGPDMFMLKSAVGRAVPDAAIEAVNDDASLREVADPGAVLLVNRVLDGAFEAADGIELIRAVTAQDDPPVAVLVSNLEDAQEEAVAAGARPGFGKSELYDARVADLLREAVGADAPATE